MMTNRFRSSAEVREMLARRSSRPTAMLPTVTVAGDVAEIRLYDKIDASGEWWGLSAKEMAATLDALPASASTVRLLINSPGGDVFDGVAIANLLRAHPARTVAVVQGVAASAASLIAVACDETEMSTGATMMIHDAWGICVGNADDMLAMGATLDTLSDTVAGFYAAKAGGDVTDWRALMKAETWYTAESAVAAGLADRVTPTTSTTTTTAAAAAAPEVVVKISAALADDAGGDPPAGDTEADDTSADDAGTAAAAMRMAAARLALLAI